MRPKKMTTDPRSTAPRRCTLRAKRSRPPRIYNGKSSSLLWCVCAAKVCFMFVRWEGADTRWHVLRSQIIILLDGGGLLEAEDQRGRMAAAMLPPRIRQRLFERIMALPKPAPAAVDGPQEAITAAFLDTYNELARRITYLLDHRPDIINIGTLAKQMTSHEGDK